jgi:hypothetical protein
MITFNKEINSYKKLKTKSQHLRADIEFLRKCKTSGVFPTFILHNIRSNGGSELTEMVVRDARMRLLKLEIKRHYARLDIMKREQYHLHLFLLDKIHTVFWLSIEDNLRDVIRTKLSRKCQRQDMKLKRLSKPVTQEPVIEVKPNVIFNKSSEEFSAKELQLLNKGLNYRPRPREPPVNEIIMAIETSLKNVVR